MSTPSHTLFFLCLAASGAAIAQDAHSGHHAQHDPSAHGHHAATPRPDVPAEPTAPDAHAGHDMHGSHGRKKDSGSDEAPEPHDMHGDHADHGDTTSRTEVDPHARQSMHAESKKEDPHAHHRSASAVTGGQYRSYPLTVDNARRTPREPIPAVTDADITAAFPALKPHSMEHASPFNSLVLFDHLEAWDNARSTGQSWGVAGWFGNDIDRLWLRSEGNRNDGQLGDWSVDALYGHAISPWWDVVAGVRHDQGHGGRLSRAAIGLQGMTPYKFETSATVYLGGDRKAELALELEYDVLLTNRLILQPMFEASIALDDDASRGVGAGLGHVEAGLRLRYEITRRFAPYIGFVHERAFGDTADLQRNAGEAASESRWVAGVRFWF